MFKEGSIGDPGNIAFDPEYPAVKLTQITWGLIFLYMEKSCREEIKRQTSGIVAKVDRYENVSDLNGITNPTIFVKYTQSGDNNEIEPFQMGKF